LSRGGLFAFSVGARIREQRGQGVDVEWLAPWLCIEHDPSQVRKLEAVLREELAPGHSLYGVPVRAIARRQDCDDVLYALDDGTGRFAVVHLTWKHRPDRPPWPWAVMYSSIENFVATGMRPDALKSES
jgi:hypothetical protein